MKKTMIESLLRVSLHNLDDFLAHDRDTKAPNSHPHRQAESFLSNGRGRRRLKNIRQSGGAPVVTHPA
jgi:hypothetical protein